MAAGEPRRRADSGMVALLHALAEMGEDESDARLLGLSRVAEGTLFAATWPTAPEKVRTLTNSDGEQAMPLFSGLETLETAARRFGWTNPDGSIPFRELPAREAMQNAIVQKVNFVVLDIHAEYSTEFTREEVSRVLRETRPMRAAAAPTRPMPPRVVERATNVLDRPTKESIKPAGLSQRPRTMSSKLAAAAIKKGQGGIAEIDQPFAERGTGKVAAPPGAGAASANASDGARGSAPARRDKRVDTKPIGSHARKETRQAMPVAHPSRTAAPQPRAAQAEAKAKPSPATPAKPRIATPLAFRMPAVDPPTVPLANVPILETREPPPAPVEPPPQARQVEALPAFEEVPPVEMQQAAPAASPRGFAVDAHPSLPVLDDPALPELPSIPASNAPLPMPPEPAWRKEPAPSTAAMPAAKAAPAPKPAAAPREPAREKRVARAAPIAVETQPEAEQPEADAAAPAEAQSGLRAPVTPLDGAVLDAIGQALRKFPEVEWASEVADEHDAAMIAVRVNPAFQTRVADIEAAVLAAGERAGASFGVLLLRDPQQMKEARSQGGTFFPWRKRTAAK